jgi:4-hydroxybenzoate polyprenyltransferase
VSSTAQEASGAAHAVPLCINLDGTLVRSDVTSEGIVRLIRDHILQCLAILWWWLQGRAVLAQRVAASAPLETAILPENEAFLDWLREQHRLGRPLVLCTTLKRVIAEHIAARHPLFNEILDSGGGPLGPALVAKFGAGGFDFAGHSWSDLPAWQQARRAIVVAPGMTLQRRLTRIPQLERAFPATPAGARTWLRALRVHQWAKNILIFLPAAGAHRLLQPAVASQSLLAFATFGLCASGTYLLNDLMDLDSDRRHPSKRRRPFAAGDLSLGSGILAACVLIGGSFALAMFLGWRYMAVLATYLVATLWYSRSLKRVAMVDVLTLAALYALRVIAGSAATAIVPSFWLLAFTMFLFLSLAVAKRFSELKLMMQAGRTDAAGRGYTTDDVPLLQACGVSSGYIAVLVMALYVNSEVAQSMYTHAQALWLLCPLLLYWITRVWIKTSRGLMHDDPVIFALRDRRSLTVGLLAAVLVVAAL